MFLRPDSQDLTAKNESTINELDAALSFLEGELAKVYCEVGFTPEEVDTILSPDSNATAEQRRLVEQTRSEIAERVEQERSQSNHAAASQKARESLPKDKSWVAVR